MATSLCGYAEVCRIGLCLIACVPVSALNRKGDIIFAVNLRLDGKILNTGLFRIGVTTVRIIERVCIDSLLLLNRIALPVNGGDGGIQVAVLNLPGPVVAATVKMGLYFVLVAELFLEREMSLSSLFNGSVVMVSMLVLIRNVGKRALIE